MLIVLLQYMHEFTYTHVYIYMYMCVYVYTIAHIPTHTHSDIYIKIPASLDELIFIFMHTLLQSFLTSDWSQGSGKVRREAMEGNCEILRSRVNTA